MTNRRLRAGGLVLVLSALAAMVVWLQPAAVVRWQERVFDSLLIALPAPKPQGPPVLVVDIGAADENGEPWDRAASARLAATLAQAGPAVVAWDIVFAGSCGDEDRNLALALGLSQAPSVLGFLLSGTASAPPKSAPTLAVTDAVPAMLWAAPGPNCPARPSRPRPRALPRSRCPAMTRPASAWFPPPSLPPERPGPRCRSKRCASAHRCPPR